MKPTNALDKRIKNLIELEKLPSCEKSERHLLACIMHKPECLDEVRSRLQVEDFFNAGHQEIFKSMLSIADQKALPTVDNVVTELYDTNRINDCGGNAYLVDLFNEEATGANFLFHARSVKRYALRRKLIYAARAMESEAWSPSDPDGLFDCAEAILADARDNFDVSETKPLSHFVHEVMDRLGTGRDAGLSTGFPKLDEYITIKPEEFTVIGARTSGGKSLLGMQLALNVVADGNNKAIIYSIEMRGREIAARATACWGRVDASYLQGKRTEVEDVEAKVANQTLMDICALPLLINESPKQSVHSISSDLRRLIRKHNLKLVVVDYLQLVRDDGTKRSTLERLSDISRNLKLISREQKIAVIALAQLNRENMKAADNEPHLHHIRGCGDIEQDADNVLLLWKPNEGSNVVSCKIAKNRNGPIGRVEFQHIPHFVRFDT